MCVPLQTAGTQRVMNVVVKLLHPCRAAPGPGGWFLPHISIPAHQVLGCSTTKQTLLLSVPCCCCLLWQEKLFPLPQLEPAGGNVAAAPCISCRCPVPGWPQGQQGWSSVTAQAELPSWCLASAVPCWHVGTESRGWARCWQLRLL